LIRPEQEQNGIELMSPVTTTFSGLNEEVLEDSILPQDLQEVLERLGTAEGGAEGALIEDVSSSAASGDEDGEPVTEDVALDLSAGSREALHARNGPRAAAYTRSGSSNRETD